MNIFLCKAMRITVIMLSLQLTGPLLLIAGGSAAQSVTVNVRQVSITEVFQIIEKQAQVSFAYNKQTVSGLPRISLNLNSKSLDLALTAIGEKLPLEFQRRGNLIAVKRTEAAEQKVGLSTEIRPTLPDTVSITGKVTDEKGSPLPGATLRIQGTDRTITTDQNGAFRFTLIQPNVILVISYIGFKNKEVSINAETTTLTIALEPNSSTLEEVIVSTGYQEIPLERATGSFSKIDNEKFNSQITTDVITRLKGIAPSILFDERSGQPKLSIRGRSTLFANDQPLIVVDNFPYDGNINNINPNDVESITILKDAAAASIWGVRAGNGVIVITTKKGRKNTPLAIELNSNVSIGQRPDLFYQPRMSTSSFIDVETTLFNNGYYNADISNTTTRPALSPVVELLAAKRAGTISSADADAQINALRSLDVRKDLEKYFYQNSVNQQYALNLRGGTSAYAYFISTGFDKNLANQQGNGYDRFTINTRQTYTPVKNLDINLGLSYIQSNTATDNTINEIELTGSRAIYPYAQLADANGNPLTITRNYRNTYIAQAESQGFLNWQFNPIEEMRYDDTNRKLSDIRLNGGVSYSFFQGLKAEVSYQYEQQQSGLRNLQPVDSYSTRDLINRYTTVSGTTLTRNIPIGDVLTFTNDNLRSHSGRAQLNYSRSWNNHAITALAGFEARQASGDGYSNRFYGYDDQIGASANVNYTTSYRLTPSNSFAAIPGFTGVSGTIDRFRSYYTNSAYTFRDKYTLSISGRIDQSNIFGVEANQRANPLGSAGVKWDLDKETFYKSEWLPQLKVRASFGYSGNLDNSVTAFTTARSGPSAVYTSQKTAFIVTPPNPDLRWERNAIFNIGIDFGTKNNIVTGSIEYFRKRGMDLIGNAPLDPTVGITSFRGNVAASKGSGWDVALSARPVSGAFNWQSDFIFSYAQDEVTKYDFQPTSIGDYLSDQSVIRSIFGKVPVVGKPMFGIFSYKWAGLDGSGNPQGYMNGQVSKDYGAFGSLAIYGPDQLIYHGPALPPLFGGFNNTFTYKQLALSLNLTYRFGYYFKRPSVNYGALYNSYTAHQDYENRWLAAGDETRTSVPAAVYPINNQRDFFYANSEILVEKGDHIRLQNVNLSYTLQNRITDKLPFKNIQVFAFATNLGLLWAANKQGIDPDFPSMKLSRVVAFGLRSSIR